jgi:hypothetical protein
MPVAEAGRIGGRTTLARHGRQHFVRIARMRWQRRWRQ